MPGSTGRWGDAVIQPLPGGLWVLPGLYREGVHGLTYAGGSVSLKHNAPVSLRIDSKDLIVSQDSTNISVPAMSIRAIYHGRHAREAIGRRSAAMLALGVVGVGIEAVRLLRSRDLYLGLTWSDATGRPGSGLFLVKNRKALQQILKPLTDVTHCESIDTDRKRKD